MKTCMDIGLLLWGQQEYAFLGSALHFIQITWFTYISAIIRRVAKWAHFAGYC